LPQRKARLGWLSQRALINPTNLCLTTEDGD